MVAGDWIQVLSTYSKMQLLFLIQISVCKWHCISSQRSVHCKQWTLKNLTVLKTQYWILQSSHLTELWHTELLCAPFDWTFVTGGEEKNSGFMFDEIKSGPTRQSSLPASLTIFKFNLVPLNVHLSAFNIAFVLCNKRCCGSSLSQMHIRDKMSEMENWLMSNSQQLGACSSQWVNFCHVWEHSKKNKIASGFLV